MFDDVLGGFLKILLGHWHVPSETKAPIEGSQPPSWASGTYHYQTAPLKVHRRLKYLLIQRDAALLGDRSISRDWLSEVVVGDCGHECLKEQGYGKRSARGSDLLAQSAGGAGVPAPQGVDVEQIVVGGVVCG